MLCSREYDFIHIELSMVKESKGVSNRIIRGINLEQDVHLDILHDILGICMSTSKKKTFSTATFVLLL